MSRVLVTGATGTIGSRVLRRLRGHGVAARAFVRRPVADPDAHVGDLDSPDTVRAALGGVSQVFLATANGPNQLGQELAVIEAAAEAGVRRIVKLSAIGAEVGSPVPFWDCHGRAEHRLREAPVDAAVLRPSFLMTNLDLTAPALFLPAAGARVAMVDPADVAAAAVAVLCDGGRETGTRELTGPASLTFHDVADALSVATGREVAFIPVDDDTARAAMVATGMPEPVAAGILAVFGRLRDGAHDRVTGDVRALTGRDPRSFLDHARASGREAPKLVSSSRPGRAPA